MKRWLWFGACIACITVCVPFWRYYIGVERIVTDNHEWGPSWEPFLKHKGTWQYRFQNPARPYLDAEEIFNLTASEMVSFREFCEIRYGTSDAEQCYRIMCAYAAGATDGCRLYAPALPEDARR